MCVIKNAYWTLPPSTYLSSRLYVPFDMWAQQRLKLACASAQSHQSIRCPHEETLYPLAIKKSPCEDSESTQGAHI